MPRKPGIHVPKPTRAEGRTTTPTPGGSPAGEAGSGGDAGARGSGGDAGTGSSRGDVAAGGSRGNAAAAPRTGRGRSRPAAAATPPLPSGPSGPDGPHGPDGPGTPTEAAGPEAPAEAAATPAGPGGTRTAATRGGGPDSPAATRARTAATRTGPGGRPDAGHTPAEAALAAAGGDARSGDGARPKRRQARGERRIAQLLDAAASVFCSTGYAAASTNAIAREAGVSPGTLYQFFPNKEAIAFELGDRLMHQWRQSHGAALAAAALDLPLEQLLDAVLDPLIAFNHENPVFAVLMHGPDIPGRITQEFDTVHQGLLTRIEEILAGYLPGTPSAEVARISAMTFAIFKAGLDLIVAHDGAERVAYTGELKAVMFRYLEPLLGEDSGICSP
ncbi:TetR/AcrR family transcriptional regulator [Streptomyces genisteinicus]|uniref:TetR/AcrR family transcriptional regulator n=1 Tax=Streptomyces genisteinicus TaxID=2768068 RepID=A0A7H0HS53_9ACTN|nr:TetR/AcrR family transcriptional regulator [Streptomyces genisteinicus]